MRRDEMRPTSRLVALFLDERVHFLDIPRLIEAVSCDRPTGRGQGRIPAFQRTCWPSIAWARHAVLEASASLAPKLLLA